MLESPEEKDETTQSQNQNPQQEEDVKERSIKYFDSREIEIPLNDFFAFIKDGEKIRILTKERKLVSELKGLEKTDGTPTENEESEKESTEIELSKLKIDIVPPKLISAKEKPTLEEIKKEVNLVDIKKEFHIKSEKDGKGKTETTKEKKKLSLMERVRKILKREKKVSPRIKLKNLSLENLKKIESIKDSKKIIIGAAAILNDFLEITFGIQRELTHFELVKELEKREMKNLMLKNQMIDFFKRIALEEYTDKLDLEDPKAVINFVENSIIEMTKTETDMFKRLKSVK